MNPIKLIIESLPEDGSTIILTDELSDLYIQALGHSGLGTPADEYLLDKLLTYLKSINLINRSKVETELINVTMLSRKT